MRRAAAALLLALPILAMTACGSGGAEEPTTAAPSAEETTTTEPAASATGAIPTSTESDGADEATTAAAGATSIETIWVHDGGWIIEETDDDLCALGGASPTPYSLEDDMFTCGPTAASADACALDEGESVLCITNAIDRRGIMFDSPTAHSQGIDRSYDDGARMPLYATLPDGATCTIISHDHDQHWNGMSSWFRCDDGSELLTSGYATDTFDTSAELWTAQRSVDQQEPETVEVATAVFAGTQG